MSWSKYEFQGRCVEYMQEGGHSFDPFDLASAWKEYQQEPERFCFLDGCDEDGGGCDMLCVKDKSACCPDDSSCCMVTTDVLEHIKCDCTKEQSD